MTHQIFSKDSRNYLFGVLKNQNGFTLIEIITVLVILGLLSVVVLKNTSINNTDLLSFESSLKNHLRYIQAKAMQSDTQIWGIRISADTDEYWFFSSAYNTGNAWNAGRILPVGAEASPGVPSSNDRVDAGLLNINIVTTTIGNSGSQSGLTLVFDKMGVPYAASGKGSISFKASLDQTGSPLSILTDNMKIALADFSGNTKTLVVHFETGFIQ